MTVDNLIALGLGLVVLVYLVITLLFPERFR